MLQSNINKRILNFFLLFIVFQPIIDIFTTFSIMKLNTGATFGLFIRCLYLLISVIFIFSQFNKNRFAKWFTLYLFVLGAFILANLSINYFTKPLFIPIEEVKFFAKLVYGNIVFLNFILVFQYLKTNSEKFQRQFLQMIYYSAVIIESLW
ncbi:O-antigen ligase family protein [Bacillus sp. N9]